MAIILCGQAINLIVKWVWRNGFGAQTHISAAKPNFSAWHDVGMGRGCWRFGPGSGAAIQRAYEPFIATSRTRIGFLTVSKCLGTVLRCSRLLDRAIRPAVEKHSLFYLDVLEKPGGLRVRQALLLVTSAVIGIYVFASAGLATAAPSSAQSKSCYEEADGQHLHGARRKAFHRACMRGALSPNRPTTSTGPSKEAQAITRPSGADRTVRSKQCSDEADKRGLAAKDREAFRLSCMATAGPVTEGETHNQPPQPAKAIPGIGVNNYKPPH